MMQIAMPRGDIRNVIFTVYDDQDAIVTQSFDEIFFTVKQHHTDRNAVIQKRLSDGSIQSRGNGEYALQFAPEDTNNLDFRMYEFDIEILKGSMLKQTFAGELAILPEVTHARNEVAKNG